MKKHFLRWLALAAIIANIAFNYLHPMLNPGNPTIAGVTDKYNSLFRPAGYAFSIWGLIYLSFIIYGIIQLLPKNRNNTAYDRLAIPMIIVNALSCMWIVLFTDDIIAASVLVIGAMLVTGCYMFIRAYQSFKTHMAPYRILIPFALFLGWISVATIANTSIYLKSINWSGAGLDEDTWANTMILVAATLGILFSVIKRDYIFPAVVAWALAAIYMEQKGAYPGMAITALIAAVAAGFFSLAALFRASHYNKDHGHTAKAIRAKHL